MSAQERQGESYGYLHRSESAEEFQSILALSSIVNEDPEQILLEHQHVLNSDVRELVAEAASIGNQQHVMPAFDSVISSSYSCIGVCIPTAVCQTQAEALQEHCIECSVTRQQDTYNVPDQCCNIIHSAPLPASAAMAATTAAAATAAAGDSHAVAPCTASLWSPSVAASTSCDVSKLRGRRSRPVLEAKPEGPQFQPTRFRRVSTCALRELLPQTQPVLEQLKAQNLTAKDGMSLACFRRYMEHILGSDTLPPEELKRLGRPIEGAAVWWPKPEEYRLKEAGVVPYLARFMSHAAGFEITPIQMQACFVDQTRNKYEVNRERLLELGIEPWNWEMPLQMHEVIQCAKPAVSPQLLGKHRLGQSSMGYMPDRKCPRYS